MNSKGSDAKTPRRQRRISFRPQQAGVKSERLEARKLKMERNEEAGVVTNPTPSKNVFIRHEFDTGFGVPDLKEVEPSLEESPTSPAPKFTMSKSRPGLIAVSLNKLSAMSPLTLVPLKPKPRVAWKCVPPVTRPPAVLAPKTPGAQKLIPVPPSTIVKIWEDGKESSKKPSLLPKTPSQDKTFVLKMPSAMMSPIVQTWKATPRRTKTPLSKKKFSNFSLPTLFAKKASFTEDGGMEKKEGARRGRLF